MVSEGFMFALLPPPHLCFETSSILCRGMGMSSCLDLREGCGLLGLLLTSGALANIRSVLSPILFQGPLDRPFFLLSYRVLFESVLLGTGPCCPYSFWLWQLRPEWVYWVLC